MDAKGIDVKEKISASRKLSKKDAVKLVKEASRIIVAKGKKVQTFSGGKATVEVVNALLGPTGNLRAPTIRVGKTLLIGFDEGSFSSVFGV